MKPSSTPEGTLQPSKEALANTYRGKPGSHPDVPGEGQLSRTLNPHQFALPGMEHLAHPFAKPLSEGLMLHYQKLGSRPGDRVEHALLAHEPGANPLSEHAGVLQWTNNWSGDYPGEVSWVHNVASELAYEKGEKNPHPDLAASLFHSAHTFNFGQDTVPVHSRVRTSSGQHFAERVRPDLAPALPDLDDETGQWKGSDWEPSPEVHPYTHRERAVRSATKEPARVAPVPGQGRLFDPSTLRSPAPWSEAGGRRAVADTRRRKEMEMGLRHELQRGFHFG